MNKADIQTLMDLLNALERNMPKVVITRPKPGTVIEASSSKNVQMDISDDEDPPVDAGIQEEQDELPGEIQPEAIELSDDDTPLSTLPTPKRRARDPRNASTPTKVIINKDSALWVCSYYYSYLICI